MEAESFAARVRKLESMLRSYRINYYGWGIDPKTKSTWELQREIDEGESIIQVDHTGILRVARILSMRIPHPYMPDLFMHVTHQWFPKKNAGRRRGKNGYGEIIAGKIKRYEEPREALERELREELQLEPSHYYLSSPFKFELDPRSSPSYEGLPNRYDKYTCSLDWYSCPEHYHRAMRFVVVSQDEDETEQTIEWLKDLQQSA
jgi:8-oxo-dGTP pyrophosphatase MutT (NUDIX family)